MENIITAIKDAINQDEKTLPPYSEMSQQETNVQSIPENSHSKAVIEPEKVDEMPEMIKDLLSKLTPTEQKVQKVLTKYMEAVLDMNNYCKMWFKMDSQLKQADTVNTFHPDTVFDKTDKAAMKTLSTKYNALSEKQSEKLIGFMKELASMIDSK